MDKLRSTLKQFVRDWSTEVKTTPNVKGVLYLSQGEAERKSSYGQMEEALVQHFAHVSEEDRCGYIPLEVERK